MHKVDYYAILGVSEDATQREIHGAFRRLAKRHHPDRNPGRHEAEMQFKRVAAAYQILGDPDARDKYDSARSRMPSPTAGEPRHYDRGSKGVNEQQRGPAKAQGSGSVVVRCANAVCGQRLRVRTDRAPCTVRCPRCRTRFIVRARQNKSGATGRHDWRTIHRTRERRLCVLELGHDWVAVTRDEIRVGDASIPCDSVTGGRYGIYKEYLNGMPIQQFCGAAVTDGEKVLNIDCTKARFLQFLKQSTIESRYNEVTSALWTAVQEPLMVQMARDLQNGAGFAAGALFCDGYGFHRSVAYGSARKTLLNAWSALVGGQTAEEREARDAHLTWQEFGGYSIGNGEVVIFDSSRKQWASLSFLGDWNAVCLPPLLDALTLQ